MRQDDINEIIIGKRVKYGILPLKKGFFDANIMGFDIEAAGNEPYSIQIFDRNGGTFQWIKGWDEEEILKYIFERASRGFNCIFAHNLAYDMGNLFKMICLHKPDFFKEYRMKVIYPDPVFMKITDKNKNKTLQFMDTLSFFKSSLKRAAEEFKINVQKLEPPKCVLEGRFPTKDELEYLKQYSVIDAQIAYELGWIIKLMHEKHDIPMTWTVTPATMSSKIIRRNFVKEKIPYQWDWINSIALRSYGGGRTESFVYGTVKCTVFDIVSSYPFAFANIPIPLERKWKKVDSFCGEEGFYIVSGTMPQMKISPLPIKERMFYFPVGRFQNVIVTGYEAKHIVEWAKIEKIKGWIYTGKRSENIKVFIEEFFENKAKYKMAGDIINYHFTKLMLNGSYGKTLQKNPMDDMERNLQVSTYDVENDDYKVIEVKRKFEAAGMFNPVIASWITGMARARLFELMKKNEEKTLYCDTDSLIVHGNYSIPTGHNLGDLDFDTKGNATIIREKLYIIREDEKIVKTGKHGYWGKPDKMDDGIMSDKSCKNKKVNYSINRMTTLREAYRQNKNPFVFEHQARELGLMPSMKREVPKQWKSFDFRDSMMNLNPIILGRKDE
jgi:hypothetical protein